MPSGDDYRIKAIDIHAQAKPETNWFNRAELEALALAYLRLAEQADRNAKTDVVYEPPLMQQQHPPRVEFSATAAVSAAARGSATNIVGQRR